MLLDMELDVLEKLLQVPIIASAQLESHMEQKLGVKYIY